MDEWRPHQITPPEESEFEELERRRQRRAQERRWMGPLLIGAGVLLAGAMSFSVCGGSKSPLEAQRLAGPTDAEVRAALEAGLEQRPAYPTEAEAAASGQAAAPAEAQPELPDVAAAGPRAETMPAPAAPAPARAVAPAPAPEVTPAAPEKPSPPAPQVAALAPQAKAPAPSESFSIQLASVRDPAATTGLWDSVLAEHPDLFSGVSPHVQKADLGARGIYHRLRVGPFASRNAAERTCEIYKARGGSCLVVTN